MWIQLQSSPAPASKEQPRDGRIFNRFYSKQFIKELAQLDHWCLQHLRSMNWALRKASDTLVRYDNKHSSLASFEDDWSTICDLLETRISQLSDVFKNFKESEKRLQTALTHLSSTVSSCLLSRDHPDPDASAPPRRNQPPRTDQSASGDCKEYLIRKQMRNLKPLCEEMKEKPIGEDLFPTRLRLPCDDFLSPPLTPPHPLTSGTLQSCPLIPSPTVRYPYVQPAQPDFQPPNSATIRAPSPSPTVRCPSPGHVRPAQLGTPPEPLPAGLRNKTPD
ncbi:hypothetical protein PAPYR_8628 [Paratrimastix pyriformis]|uniref:Uncharacterized protein n=1 Tax=Paratrimastix pyriformis TaxID=342808 RepID=A0ABQ8UEG9_9EUKA|nr:hypothetical protein PAPYR_8628 [Paratrimastix pyriformis]